MTLREFLLWGTTVGSGVLAWWILARIIWPSTVSDELKRYIAAALSGVIALACWCAQIAMQYVAMPGDWRAWVEAAAGILAVAFTTSQLAQARQKQIRLMRARRINRESLTPRG
jgi:tellurite resistance protein TehA-like permease